MFEAKFPWTPELKAEAVRLFKEDGESASVIASRLARQANHPLTRNAVIGVVTRAGASRGKENGRAASRINGRASRGEGGPKPGKSSASAAVNAANRVAQLQRLESAPAPKMDPHAAPPTAVDLVGLTFSACKWPVGQATGADQLFCGGARDGEGPYCKGHGRAAKSTTTVKPIKPPADFSTRRSPAAARAA